MITKFEKQAVALLLTIALCLSLVLSGTMTMTVRAEEGNGQTEEAVLEQGEVSGDGQISEEGEPSLDGAALTKEDSVKEKDALNNNEPSKQSEEESAKEEEKAGNDKKASRAGTGNDSELFNNVEGDYTYRILDDDTVEIGLYNGSDTVVSVPDTLDGKRVSSIWGAFEGNTNLTQVELPATVTIVQYGAFAGCDSLKKVVLPADSQLKTIGKYAFKDSGLEEIDCGPAQEISADAFGRCANLTTVVCGNVASIGVGAFASCGSLSKITLSNSLGSIENSAFAHCKSLKEITLPDSLVSIGSYAFWDSGLEKIDIPASVTDVGEGAFADCKGLSSIDAVNFGSALTYIPAYAFQNCGLEAVMIGGQVKRIGIRAFESNKISEVVIPKNVTEIEYGAFRNCESLAGITLPDTLEKIGGRVFDRTAWLASQPDGVVYAANVLYSYKGDMPSNTEIAAKEGTLGIASFAFEGYENLRKITIPDGVTNIGAFAFYDCSSMTSVTIPGSVTEIGEYALGYIASKSRSIYRYDGGGSAILASGSCEQIPGFTIYGETGSAAETYATENEFNFISTNASEPTFPKVPAQTPSSPTNKTLRIIPEATDNIYVIGSEEGATITCTGEFKDFVSVYVDDQEVDRSNYTVREGSTILTFMTKYLNTLSVGKHKVTMNYTYGSVDTELNVLERKDNTTGVKVPNNNSSTVGTNTAAAGVNTAAGTANRTNVSGNARAPKTGDNTLLLFWILTILMASGVSAAMIRRKYLVRS